MSEHDRSAPGAADSTRALPDHPNLAFERKQARQLLRGLHRNEPDAVTRLRARKRDDLAPETCKLADAQLVIAREYGFRSWPQLVTYFTSWDRQHRSQPVQATYRVQHYLDSVTRMLASHAQRSWSVAPALATWVPRMYGRSDDEIFATTLGESDAQLVVARQARFSSWQALLAASEHVGGSEDFQTTPWGRAQSAIGNDDMAQLQVLVEQHPELLHAPSTGPAAGRSIIHAALRHERMAGTAAGRAMTDWLARRGADLQSALNELLTGWRGATRPDFELLIARGANPHWVPANGIPLLEHVLLRCWNPGPADVLARYVTRRPALWIAAGMDDIKQLPQYFDGRGALTPAARRDRPDFTATQFALPTRPGAPDRDIMFESFTVAAFNQRFEAMDWLVARGFPIDYSPWRFNLLHWAVGNRIVPVAAHLIARGADVNLKGWQPHASAREMAAENLKQMPDDAAAREVARLCGV